jgi:osmoprotectant transport system substrate-binding protein
MKRLVWLLAVLLSALVLVACGDDDDEGGGAATTAAEETAIQSDPNNASTSITVGSKNFGEAKLLGEIYAQGLAAAGYKVSTERNLGDEQTALKALETEQIDAYPEYTGTILGSFLGVKTADLPKDAQAAYRQAKAGMAKKGVEALPTTPFTSSNEVAVTRETAQRENLAKISDLSGKAGELTLYGTPECRQRIDCLLGLQHVYGLEFESFVPVAIDLRHEVLRKGQADVSIVFTTDPQIKRNDAVLLEDDKGMFPPNNTTLLVNEKTVAKAGPDLERVVEQVNEGLTDEAMQELNARVELDKKTPNEVAKEYLQETGLTS